MAIDPRIPLMLGDTGAPFKAVSDGIQRHRQNKVQAQQLSNENERLQILKDQAVQQKQRSAQEREMFRLRSIATAGLELMPLIQARDKEGVIRRLQTRRKTLEDAGVDNFEETDAAIEMAAADDWEGLGREVAGAVQLGFSTGVLKSQDSGYGRVIEGVGDDGEARFFQINDSGGVRVVEGFKPPPKSPLGTIQLEDGTVITMGGAAPATDKPIVQELTELGDTLDTLDRIEEGFKPEFHTLGTRFDTFVTSTKALAGMDVSDEDKSQLQDYSTYVASVSENQSKLMNRLSGAAVSPSEAKRLEPFILQPGDDPITAEAKIRNFRTSVELATARRNYLRYTNKVVNNAAFQQFPLQGMKSIMKEENRRLIEEIGRQNPTMPAEKVRENARLQLKMIFGL